MDEFYGPDHRRLQARFDTARLADRLNSLIVQPALDAASAGFIQSRPMFFLSTIDHRGFPTCSYKGGEPGFVRVLNERTLAFPSYDGNGMFLSLGNIGAQKKIGMLFIDFETPHRLRLHGEATLHENGADGLTFPGANLIVRVAIQEVFVNCPRYVHKHTRLETSQYAPAENKTVPAAVWKRIDALRDTLPEPDRHIAETSEPLTIEEYMTMVATGEG